MIQKLNVEQRQVFDLMRVVLDSYAEEIAFQQSNHLSKEKTGGAGLGKI